MRYASPRTRFLKVTTPWIVFIGVTFATVWTFRDDWHSKPLITAIVVVFAYLCMAWVLWRPLRLKVADEVVDQGHELWIRRGKVECAVPYSQIRNVEYVRIGTITSGAKLNFSQPTPWGSSIGFYINDDQDSPHGPPLDRMLHLEERLKEARA